MVDYLTPDAGRAPLLLSLDPVLANVMADETRITVFGQDEALTSLTGMIRGVLETASSRTSPPRSVSHGVFALLGRYGQGKSTLLAALRTQIEGKRLDRYGRSRKLRVSEFDVASHTPDNLNYEFDRLISHWNFWWRVGLSFSLSAFTIAFAVFILPTLLPRSLSSLLTAAVAGGAVGVVAIWEAVLKPILSRLLSGSAVQLRRVDRAMNFGDMRLARQVAREMWHGRPDLLIIDNLDRAIPEQQRAFLLALRRHRTSLPPAVVVAFDETPLTLSDASPDTPQELLSKAFTSAVRLFPMTRFDAEKIVLDIVRYLIRQDPSAERQPLLFLRYMHVAGDLARILLFHRRHSVRFCRQFVNIVATAATTMDIAEPADFSALMRLQGLFEFLPWIRNDPVALGDMLEDEETEKILQYAASLAGKTTLSTDVKESVTTYMQKTRHMQPAYVGWEKFIAWFSGKPHTRLEMTHASPLLLWTEPPDRAKFFELWLKTDLEFAYEPGSKRRAKSYITKLHQQSAQLHPEREGPEDQQDRFVWAFLLHRLWQADADALFFHGSYIEDYAKVPTQRADWWSHKDPESEVRQAVPEALIKLFMQIAWPLPPSLMDIYAGAVAAANAPLRGERAIERWLDRLLREGNAREPRFLALFGQYLDTGPEQSPSPDSGYGLVLTSLPDLPSVSGETQMTASGRAQFIDWPLATRLADLRGRILRDGHSGALIPMQRFIREMLKAFCDDVAGLKQLMRCAAAGLPSVEGPADGLWREDAIESLKMVFGPDRSADHQDQFSQALKGLCFEPTAGNLLLLALAAGDHESVATIAQRWHRPRDCKSSYAEKFVIYLDLFVGTLRAGGASVTLEQFASRMRPYMRQSARSIARTLGRSSEGYARLIALLRTPAR